MLPGPECCYDPKHNDRNAMENFNPGENMRKMLDIDTSVLEEKKSEYI